MTAGGLRVMAGYAFVAELGFHCVLSVVQLFYYSSHCFDRRFLFSVSGLRLVSGGLRSKVNGGLIHVFRSDLMLRANYVYTEVRGRLRFNRSDKSRKESTNVRNPLENVRTPRTHGRMPASCPKARPSHLFGQVIV